MRESHHITSYHSLTLTLTQQLSPKGADTLRDLQGREIRHARLGLSATDVQLEGSFLLIIIQ
jgi:hypothetical protein